MPRRHAALEVEFEGDRLHQTVRRHRLVEYHRPTSLGDAIALLAELDRVVYAGGTTLHHSTTGEPVGVVDIQALGLDRIDLDSTADGSIRIGATVTLEAISQHDGCPAGVRAAARAELPSTLRTLATIGGTIGAADAHSVLLASLLVHDAEVSFADGHVEPLGDVLGASSVGQADRTVPGLIVSIEIATGGRSAALGTGRTPADAPIVAAVARRDHDGQRLALCGVADVPIIVEPDDLAALDPPTDFRGSSAYRRELAGVLSRRVIAELS